MIRVSKLDHIVFIHAPVSYIQSLELMRSADILLIIDVLAEKSPFLPSKLIDYIGANKPIFGVTPPGTSQKLEKMGFLVANPSNISEIANKLIYMIEKFSKDKLKNIPSSVRDRYSVSTVGAQMKIILKNV